MNKKLVLITAAATGLFLLAAVFLIRQKIKETEEPEEPAKREAEIKKVLKDLTAPVSSKKSVISQEIIQKLTAPKDQKNQAEKDILESLTAP